MELQKIGRYEIKAELGRGGMATVYLAYDPRFEREVAIKVLPHEMLHDPQFRTRFEREAKTIAMLEHPAIVPVYDFGEEDGQPYFVMRYMTGGSLSDRLKKEPISVQEAARLIDHLAPALDDAHIKGIIHRDIKPGNILFDQYNEPYISDFGIAKIAAGQSNVTGSAIIGTPAYMSPEQAQGDNVDGRSDIYGLGIILFEMLTSTQPYHGDTPMSVVVKHITDPIPHILDVKPELPAAIEAVIEKAMAKDRNERFQNVRSLAEALNAVARGETPDLTSDVEKTLVGAPKTALGKRRAESLPETVLSKRGIQAQGSEAPRKRSAGWIIISIAGLALCLALVVGVILFKDKIPFLAAVPSPTNPVVVVVGISPTLEIHGPAETQTPTQISATVTPTDTPTPTPTNPPVVTGIGGADLIAFLNANNVWVANVDGSELNQLTADGSAKHDLQWSPDGQSVFYISGKCILAASLMGNDVKNITCFNAADYLDAFEISPDGSRVAISMNRVLYVVPFDLTALGNARTHVHLLAMEGGFSYDEVGVKGIRWSNDGHRIALKIVLPEGGIRVDMIRVVDISAPSIPIDNFPGSRFSMNGFNDNPTIPSYDWDGETLFLLNSNIRNEWFGYLYSYNIESMQTADKLDPMKTSCCYTNAVWSPDGSYVLLAHQDINLGPASRTKLYYLPYGTISTGATYTPIPLPEDFFANPRENPSAVLRPGQP